MVIGILVILYPILTEVYGGYVSYRLNREWDKQLARQEEEAVSAEAEQISKLGRTTVSEENSVLAQAVGTLSRAGQENFPPTKIKIPKIGLEQVVLSGVDVETLKKGPGHYPGTPNPGQRGNVGIAGHRVTYTHPFNQLDELKPGDMVILETLDKVYEYRVTSSKVLDPNDLSALMPTKDGRARVTLTTCTPKYSAKYRLDVQASLARITPRQRQTFLRRLVSRISKPSEDRLPKNILELAVSQGQQAVAESPNDADARTYLGTIYRNIGRYDDAISQLQKAIEIDPKEPNGYYQLALVYQKIGRTSEAIIELNRAIEQGPDFESAYYRLGKIYLEQDQTDDAIRVLGQSIVLNTFSADTHYLLGRALEKKGDTAAARVEYEQALKYVPDLMEARAALKRLNK